MGIKSALKTAVKGVAKTAFLPYGIASTALAKARGKEAQKQQTKEILTGAAIMTSAVTGGFLGAKVLPKALPLAKKVALPSTTLGKVARSAALSGLGTGAVYLAKKAISAPKKVAKSGAAKAIAAGALSGAALGYGAAKLSGSEALQQKALNMGLASTGEEMGVLSKVTGFAKSHPLATGAIGGLIGAGAGYAGYKALKGMGTKRRSSRSNIITKRGMKTLRKIKKYRKQIRKAMSAVGIKSASSQSKSYTPFRRRRK